MDWQGYSSSGCSPATRRPARRIANWQGTARGTIEGMYVRGNHPFAGTRSDSHPTTGSGVGQTARQTSRACLANEGDAQRNERTPLGRARRRQHQARSRSARPDRPWPPVPQRKLVGTWHPLMKSVLRPEGRASPSLASPVPFTPSPRKSWPVSQPGLFYEGCRRCAIALS